MFNMAVKILKKLTMVAAVGFLVGGYSFDYSINTSASFKVTSAEARYNSNYNYRPQRERSYRRSYTRQRAPRVNRNPRRDNPVRRGIRTLKKYNSKKLY